MHPHRMLTLYVRPRQPSGALSLVIGPRFYPRSIRVPPAGSCRQRHAASCGPPRMIVLPALWITAGFPFFSAFSTAVPQEVLIVRLWLLDSGSDPGLARFNATFQAGGLGRPFARDCLFPALRKAPQTSLAFLLRARFEVFILTPSP